MSARRRAAFIAAILVSAARAEGQKPQVMLSLPDAAMRASEPPIVRSAALITDGATLDLLRNGFPAHLHYKLERWNTGGFFDDVTASAEWDAVVRYDALAKVFQVYRVAGGRTTRLGSFSDIAAAEAAIDTPFPAPIQPPKKGKKTYYNLVLDVESLSLTELDEVERWLRGELKPAVRGKKNPGTAVGRGVRTVMVRLLGGEKRRYEARSGTFRP
ncbi:MAG: hypothetical protein ABIQ55_01970 [Gemmatimonadaceae bacterium]